VPPGGSVSDRPARVQAVTAPCVPPCGGGVRCRITGATRTVSLPTPAASLAALAEGAADLACIDALTLVHLSAAQPDLVAWLNTVGRGPWIPSPVVVVRAGIPAGHRHQLAVALHAAVSDPSIGGPLHYDGFVPLDATGYEPTLHLVPT
jgi:hypothetical protein